MHVSNGIWTAQAYHITSQTVLSSLRCQICDDVIRVYIIIIALGTTTANIPGSNHKSTNLTQQ